MKLKELLDHAEDETSFRVCCIDRLITIWAADYFGQLPDTMEQVEEYLDSDVDTYEVNEEGGITVWLDM
jgi:hypothetical protein